MVHQAVPTVSLPFVHTARRCNRWRQLGFAFGGSGVFGGLLCSCLGLDSLVKIERGVLITNWSDELFFVEILDQSTSDGSTDLELLAEDGSSDAEDLWDLLDHSLVSLLFQENGVVKLLLYLDLGPGLLLSFSCCGFTFGHLRRFGRSLACILATHLLGIPYS
jgi:hypothetical protein